MFIPKLFNSSYNLKTDIVYRYVNHLGKESIFLKKAFYEEICATITDFFEEKLIINEAHKKFITHLNSLKNGDDIEQYRAENMGSFHIAIAIINNESIFDIQHSFKGKTMDDYWNWWRNEYYIKVKNYDSIIDNEFEDKYFYADNNVNKIFLTNKYHDFVLCLVSDFFKNDNIKNYVYNKAWYYFLMYLRRIDTEDYLDKIIAKEPYQWAMSIIKDEENNEVLNDELLKNYYSFREEFLKRNNIDGFIINTNSKN